MGRGGERGAGDWDACRKSFWELSMLVRLVLEFLGYISFSHSVDRREI